MKTNTAVACVSILAAALLGAAPWAFAAPGVSAGAGAAAATPTTSAATASQKSFDAFTDDLAAEWMRANPTAATNQQYFSGEEQDGLDRELVAEVERYVVMPGQACGYKMGELEILAQRGREQAALGSTFSMKAFHTLLLHTGTVPLGVLRQVVDADIAARLKP